MSIEGKNDQEFITPDSPVTPRVLLSRSLAEITEHVPIRKENSRKILIE
jgi:hypothetical protein